LIPNAESWALRGVVPNKGKIKGAIDALHGLPMWWAISKAVQKKDFKYIYSYLATKLADKDDNPVLAELANIYFDAAYRKLIDKFSIS
jgi:hypothetical protein